MQSAYGEGGSRPASPAPSGQGGNTPGGTHSLTPDTAPMLGEIQELFRRVLMHNGHLQNLVNNLQANTDTGSFKLQQLNDQLSAEIAALKVGRADKAMMLVDSKNMCPSTFNGTQSALYRP